MNTTAGRDTVKNDGGLFLIGFITGFFACVVFTLVFLYNMTPTIQTYEKIQPEKRLTTDGKTVDTLFIYKQER